MHRTFIDSSALPAAALQIIVKDLYLINFNIVAASAFLFWDILLTFDREVEYIWKSKFSLITVLFGGMRLLAVGGNIVFLTLGVGVLSVTEPVCKGILWFEAILGLVMSAASDTLLIFRVYAFYGKNKALLVSLCILEVVASVAVFVLIMQVSPKGQVAPNPLPHQLNIGSCLLPNIPRLSSDTWIPVLCVQSILFSLAMGRYIYLQSKGPILLSRIYYTFLRDGIWCFVVLFALYTVCIVGIEMQSVLGLVSLYWCFPLIGFCTSRLILNLRSARDDPSKDYSLDVLSTNLKVNSGMGVHVHVAYQSYETYP